MPLGGKLFCNIYIISDHITVCYILVGMIYTVKDVEKLGSIMGIWAHPDDESWSSAGIMAAAGENGQSVSVLCATNGDAGQTANETSWSQVKLRDIRKEELRRALAAVGVQDYTFLDYEDGKLDRIDSQIAIEAIIKHIKAFSPDTILTFEENGITGHGDHRTISTWARQAIANLETDTSVYGAVETQQTYDAIGKQADELFNVYFAIDEPVLYDQDTVDLQFILPPALQEKKRQTLRAHASQTHQLFKHDVGKKLLKGSLEQECFIRLN